MSLESVERVLSGTACPALRGLLGKQVTAISAPQWLSAVPKFTSLHEVHLGEIPGESLPQVLELPKLKVLNVSKVAGSPPDGLQADGLEILMAPGRLTSALACPNLQKLLIRIDGDADAGDLTSALLSNSLVALDILDLNRKLTLRSLFTAIRDSGPPYLQRFVYLRPPARNGYDLFEGTLLAFRSSVPLQCLKFACLSLNENPSRRNTLEAQLLALHQRAPELKICVPDWPGDAPKVAGLCWSDLRTWSWSLKLLHPSPIFEDLVYQRLPAFTEQFRGPKTGFKFATCSHPKP